MKTSEFLGRLVGWLLAPLFTVFVSLPFCSWLFGVTLTATGGTLLGAFYTLLLANLILVAGIFAVLFLLYCLYKYVVA